jgi:hypothetical protein
VPDFFVVTPARGSAKPRSQGAELTKIDAIWTAAVQCGIAVGPNAQAWIDWYAKSLEAGQAQELPEAQADSQQDMARFENFLMLDQGEDVQPADYDLMAAHIPEHREAQNQARAAGDLGAYQRIEQHIQAHIQLQAANAAKIAAAQQTPSPAAPVAGPATGITRGLDGGLAAAAGQAQPGGTPIFPMPLLPPAASTRVAP